MGKSRAGRSGKVGVGFFLSCGGNGGLGNEGVKKIWRS